MSSSESHPPSETSPLSERRGSFASCLLASMALAGVLFIGLVVLVWWLWPTRLSEEEVKRAVVSTIQQEAPASFYVTGHLDVTVTSKVRNTEIFLPGVLDLEVGTTQASVRVPGRLFYGFDVRQLRAEDIQVGEDGAVTVTLPELRLHSVEPDLEQMEVETSAGWTRLYDGSRERAEREAVRRVQSILRRQGAAHLHSSTQPRINTARALHEMLAPVLEAAGVPGPKLRIRIGDELVMQPQG